MEREQGMKMHAAAAAPTAVPSKTRSELSASEDVTANLSEMERENLKTVQGMSAEDVAEAQAELEAILDPETIKFFKSGGFKKLKQSDPAATAAAAAAGAATGTVRGQAEPQSAAGRVQSQEEDAYEKRLREQTEWLKPVQPRCVPCVLINYRSSAHVNDESPLFTVQTCIVLLLKRTTPRSPARHGWAGWRVGLDGLPQSAGSASSNPALYHHGTDADKPGYLLEELLHLTRSTVPAQRSANTLLLGKVIRRCVCVSS